jgi:signal transduction histidine kinase
LIDNNFQYVLAEATRSLSLMDDGRHNPGDELWMGNARLPRGQGVSEDALYPEEYAARNAKGEEFRSPALVIQDLAVHPRYMDKEYAGAGGINFYAGVPITTSRGHTIGVYTIVDNQPRKGLSVEELHSMVDMAAIVLQHLEGIRNERARARGERLIQGIGTFIEGDPIDATLSIESPGPNHIADPLDAAGRLQQRPKLSRSRESSGNFKGLTIVDANSVAREQYSSQEDESNGNASYKRILPPVRKDPVESPEDPYKAKQRPKSQHVMVFDRAARIMRKCLGADGVAFVDASSANLSKGTARKDNDTSNSTSVQHTQKKKSSSKPKPQSAVTPEVDGETPSATNTGNPMDQAMETKQLCEIIALTMRDVHSDSSMDITEHELRKLVRRYPQGKAYTFDADGNLATSDDSASEGVVHVDGQNGDNGGDTDSKIKRKEPKKNALHASLPKARTIVFLPLWDFANQRWNAAAVIWSSHPTKMMNVGQDFSYLRAFANSVMNEIARLNLSVSDAAKATFLANISHELRSPLHGILGSIEFLHDTALDDFQSGMVISVETCGKTLLDTVNHVLDFAKLNNLSKQGGNRKGTKASSSTHTPVTSTFDLAVVVEEGVEAVYAGQVFRTASQDAVEGQGPALSSNDRSMATRQKNKDQIALGQAVTSDSVRLTLNIDDGINWHVTSQPGAVRRIVMNLLGNALKYTPAGSINVSLEIDSTRTHEQEAGLLHSCITVTDTGKGMSDDFVRNHAFTAFSQEDSLATGTGLGLSIIRSIVDSLGGEIDLRSQKDLGTEVKIWLSLPAADDQSDGPIEKNILHQVAQRTAGMSLCLLSPPMPNQSKEQRVPGLRDMPTVEDSLRNLLSQWYSLNIFTAPSMEKVDNADFFVYAEPPAIEYLLNQHGRHAGDKEVPVIIFCQNAFQASSLRANGIHHLTEIGKSATEQRSCNY